MVKNMRITHDHLQTIGPLFDACLECNMAIATRCEEAATVHSMSKSINPQAEKFLQTCTTRVHLPTNQVPQTLTAEALKHDDEEDDCFQGGDKDVETIDGKILDWLENFGKECHEGPPFDEDAHAELVADWWEKWTGVRSHVAREFGLSYLFVELARNAQRRPKWYMLQSVEQLPLLNDLTINGLRQMPIKGEGNCTFCAIAHFSPHDHTTMRKLVMDEVLKNRREFQPF